MFATWVYTRYLAARGLRRTAWSWVRLAMIRLLKDPLCAMSVHGRTLMLPLSHPLPDYLARYRFYDRLPQRLSAFIRTTHGALVCIDVGANVGDTVAAFCQAEADVFLAIEPEPGFATLLKKNWGWNPNVTIISALCSAETGADRFAVFGKNGSASFVPDGQGVPLNRRRLDELVDECPSVGKVNVLKIDTDGHDIDVLDGAKEVIARNRPAILFECDAYDDVHYIEQCLQTLAGLKNDGYNGFLVYDNYGYLIGRYALDDLSAYRNLLCYHLAGGVRYFDLLVMENDDLDFFHAAEKQVFCASRTHVLMD